VTGSQIAALICAILLLLPGGCFLFYGIFFAVDETEYGLGFLAFVLLPIAAVILTGAGLLFWAAFRLKVARRMNRRDDGSHRALPHPTREN